MNKNLEGMAMFMICLIVTLPIYVSSVYAGINNVKAYGVDGVDGVIRKDYDLAIEVDVSNIQNLTASNLKIVHSLGLSSNFDSCAASGNTSVCKVNLVKNSNSQIEICPYTDFDIKLYDSASSLIDTKNVIVKCDSNAPNIILSVSPASTNGGDVILSYTITDPENSNSKCSGIEKIEFYTNSLTSGASTIIPNITSCKYSSTTTIPTSGYNDGAVVIYVKAFDLMGQESISDVSFLVDKSGPAGSGSVTIKDSNGNLIPYFKAGDVFLDVVLDITDASSIDTYNLDYSDLTNQAPRCAEVSGNIRCKWDNLKMHMASSSFTKNILLDAVDTYGNDASTTVSIQGSLPEDNTLPTIVISEITIDTPTRKSMDWFRPGEMKMSFYADIKDDLSGIESITGDFSNINIVSGETPICTGSVLYYRCTWSNVRFNMNSASFSQSISVIAKDFAENEKIETTTASATFTADSSVPSVDDFRITDSRGRAITGWIGKSSKAAKIAIDISEEGAGLLSAYGLFTDINPTLYAKYKKGTCSQLSGPSGSSTTSSRGVYQGSTVNSSLPKYTYECDWNVDMEFNTSGNPLTANFKFNITDNSLNSATPSFTESFNVDVDGPVVTSLKTNNEFSGTYYVGMGDNTFKASITDSGIGLNDADIYLDLSNLKRGTVKADNCTANACYWYDVGIGTIAETEYEVYITTDSIDDLGNKLKTKFGINVTADVTKPVVNSVNISGVKASSSVFSITGAATSITPISASTPAFREFLQTGNALQIIAEVVEPLSLKDATGDFSNFITDETNVFADECVRSSAEDDIWTCTWTTNEIDITSYKKDNIFLNFTDVAGNVNSVSIEIEVFESSTTTADHWEAKVKSSSPDAIDKQIITLYKPSMWFEIDLESKDGKSASKRWPLEVSVAGCFGNETDSAGTPTVNYISSASGNAPTLSNPNTGTATNLPYTFYLNYELEKTPPPDTSIKITCRLKIRTLVDGKKISASEEETLTVTINYYNNPLGTLASNVQNEIDNVKDSWLVKAEWLGTINSLMGVIGGLCSTINNLIRVASFIAFMREGPIKVPLLGEVAAPAIGATALGVQATGKAMHKVVQPLCKMLNCQLFHSEFIAKTFEKITKFYKPVMEVGEAMGTKTQESPNVYWDIKNSIILSTVFLCIPGVVYNLQKARAIDCTYANCLKSAQSGLPVQMCVKQRDYAWCSYVYGQIFNLLPFKGLFDISRAIKSALENPVLLISVIVKGFCIPSCVANTKIPAVCPACIYVDALETFIDVLCDLGIGKANCEPFWSNLEVDDSSCDGL